jgi:hypothetical protein
MPDALPLSLIVAWSVFGAAVFLQREHMSRLNVDYRDDRSTIYFFAVAASVIVAGLVSLALLYRYWTVAGWLWTIALFACMTVDGSLIAIPFGVFVHHRILGRAGFVVWPLAAGASYVLIDGLPR